MPLAPNNRLPKIGVRKTFKVRRVVDRRNQAFYARDLHDEIKKEIEAHEKFVGADDVPFAGLDDVYRDEKPFNRRFVS